MSNSKSYGIRVAGNDLNFEENKYYERIEIRCICQIDYSLRDRCNEGNKTWFQFHLRVRMPSKRNRTGKIFTDG